MFNRQQDYYVGCSQIGFLSHLHMKHATQEPMNVSHKKLSVPSNSLYTGSYHLPIPRPRSPTKCLNEFIIPEAFMNCKSPWNLIRKSWWRTYFFRCSHSGTCLLLLFLILYFYIRGGTPLYERLVRHGDYTSTWHTWQNASKHQYYGLWPLVS
jgi:hypothetical protein